MSAARGDAGQGDDTALNDRIASFNASIPAVVKAHAEAGKHVLLVDMHTPFGPDTRSLFEDQWHPNAAGYVRIGAQWCATLQAPCISAYPP